MVAIVICALLAVGAITFTLLVRQRDIPPAPVENPELKALETRRQVLFENLKDLQFEYHQGKLSDGDYQSLKSGFQYDLAALMDSIERLKADKGRGTKTTAKAKQAGTATGSGVAVAEGSSGSQSSQRLNRKAETEAGSNAKSKATNAATSVAEVECPACATPNPSSNRFCGGCGAALVS